MNDVPRFFFDTDDGDHVRHDKDGSMLAGVHDAVDEARKLAFDLFYGAPVIGRTILACVVKDEGGGVVYRLMVDISGEIAGGADPN